MSDNLVKRLRNPPFGTESSERNLMASAADALDTQAAEITRLRAELATARLVPPLNPDPWLPVIDQADIEAALQRKKSRDSRLVEQEAEITRLRAALATARREGMEDAAKWHEVRSMELSGKAGLARNFRQLLQQSDFHMESAAAIRAAAKEVKP